MALDEDYAYAWLNTSLNNILLCYGQFYWLKKPE